MPNLLKKLFTLPKFDDDMQTYTARMLRVALSFIAVISFFYTVINIASDLANSLRYLLQFVFIIVTLAIMFFLIHKGQPRAASLILVFCSWVIFSAAAFTGGGIISAAYMGYLVVLMLAGVVTAHPSWTLAVAALCAVSGYGLLSAEANGLLPVPTVAVDSRSVWLDSLIYFSLVASLQILASRIVIDALNRARQDGQEKQKAEEREKRRAVLLRQVIELGKDVTQAAELDWCLKKIHHSIQKGLGFERVGIFLYDENTRILQGSYGTDRQGNIKDISHLKENADDFDAWEIALRDPDGMRFIKNYSEQYNEAPGSPMHGVTEHITLAAWAGNQPVALIAVDNALSNQPIETETMEALRLFVGYAGLAIVNAQNLKAINHELESFSYSVSHDLRSPLRAVVGFSQILMTDFKQDKVSDSLLYLKKIHENGKKMGLLIDDLLSFSRVGRQTLRITQCDTKIIVENIIEKLKEKYTSRSMNWIVQDLPPCKADYGMIQQVWLNLLENANKYSFSSSEPTIEIGSFSENGQSTYFVRDNGKGFDMQYASKIFSIFQRLEPDDSSEGTGIGLSIVQRIIQRHGGRVWATSETGKGATFYFSLP